MGIEALEETVIAGFYDRARLLVRTHHIEPPNLEVCDLLAQRRDLPIRDIDSGIERQDAPRLVDVRLLGPAKVEHAFG